MPHLLKFSTATGLILAALAGALSTLAFAPFGLWPLALVSAGLLLITLQKASAKQAFWRGWSYGFGFFITAVSWVYVSIHDYGAASLPVASLLTLLFAAGLAFFFALQGLAYQHLQARADSLLSAASYAKLLLFPAVWVLTELFRGWFLTGFPWLLIGYAPMDTTLAGWAPITGVFGLSFLTVFSATALTLGLQGLIKSSPFAPNSSIESTDNTIERPKNCRSSIGLLLTSLVPFAIGYALQPITYTQALGQPLKTLLVQGDTPQNQKWIPRHRQAILDQHLALTLAQPEAPLIIWPETAVPELLQNIEPKLQQLSRYLLNNNSALLTGIPSRAAPSDDGKKRYHNSVIGLGTASGIYHKQRLVPFGEYVPLESVLRGVIAFFDLPMSSFSLGPTNQTPIQLPNEIEVAPYICYEIVYPDLVASVTGNIILTVSNDTWFGDSLAPPQHLQMARMRALETERFVIRATNNGISAVIDEKGTIRARAPQFTATTLTSEVQPLAGSTPFSRLGSWPIGLLCILIVLSVVIYHKGTN